MPDYIVSISSDAHVSTQEALEKLLYAASQAKLGAVSGFGMALAVDEYLATLQSLQPVTEEAGSAAAEKEIVGWVNSTGSIREPMFLFGATAPGEGYQGSYFPVVRK